MRYIKKIPVEQLDKIPATKALLDYINVERNPSNPLNPIRHPNYNDLKSDKEGKTFKDLKKQLLKENYHLCSFCQENVGTKILVEHLNPQSIFKSQEVDYYNLYLCCQTKGQCSDAKKDDMIIHFLAHERCADFFKYTWNGEILPNCNFTLWEGHSEKGCKENLDKLNTLQLQIYSAIDTLGLNRQPLLARRLNTLEGNGFRKSLKDNMKNKEWLENEKASYEPQENTKILPDFSGMFLYFLNERIKKLN